MVTGIRSPVACISRRRWQETRRGILRRRLQMQCDRGLLPAAGRSEQESAIWQDCRHQSGSGAAPGCGRATGKDNFCRAPSTHLQVRDFCGVAGCGARVRLLFPAGVRNAARRYWRRIPSRWRLVVILRRAKLDVCGADHETDDVSIRASDSHAASVGISAIHFAAQPDRRDTTSWYELGKVQTTVHRLCPDLRPCPSRCCTG